MRFIGLTTTCLLAASFIFSLGNAFADSEAYQQMQLSNALAQLSSGRMLWDNKGDIDEAATHYMVALGYLTSPILRAITRPYKLVVKR